MSPNILISGSRCAYSLTFDLELPATLSSNTARDWATRLLNACGIRMKKPRHGRRKVSAMLAELALCPEPEVS
jgi:hypothetical protein